MHLTLQAEESCWLLLGLVVGYLMVPEILSWPRSEMLSFDLQGPANPESEA